MNRTIMAKKIYRARIADKLLNKKLKGIGAILIQGPKWCGKTTTAEQQAKSILYMDNPEIMDQNVELARIALRGCYRGKRRG